MGNSIRLSEKHGVNPTMGVCFWCGKDDGSIGLLGLLKGDVEAPRRMMLSYDPCAACKEIFAKGFTLLECSERPNVDGQPPIQRSPVALYPTGNLAVLEREAAKRIFGEKLTRKDKGFCEVGVIARLEEMARVNVEVEG